MTLKFLAGLFGRKRKAAPQAQPVNGIEVDAQWNAASETMADAVSPVAVQTDLDETGTGKVAEIPSALDSLGKSRGDQVANIWDLEDGAPGSVLGMPASGAAGGVGASKTRRNRTRLLGFEKSSDETVDLFQDAPRVEATGERMLCPAGFLMVMSGPGRGHVFPVMSGMSTIGRGIDQVISLDFGDNAISRDTHAAIVYDAALGGFVLGAGGKANIVRLNNKPVISNETLHDGDAIQLGETTLQLKAICDADFDWADAEDGEDLDDDVAIA